MIAIMPSGDIIATTDKEADACELLVEGFFERSQTDPRRFRNLMAEKEDGEKKPCQNCRGL